VRRKIEVGRKRPLFIVDWKRGHTSKFKKKVTLIFFSRLFEDRIGRAFAHVHFWMQFSGWIVLVGLCPGVLYIIYSLMKKKKFFGTRGRLHMHLSKTKLYSIYNFNIPSYTGTTVAWLCDAPNN
jgi:hypothetical protein